MRYRDSLRFRIFATFLVVGLLLGPLLALGFITLANELEELSIQSALVARLHTVMNTSVEPDDAASGATGWRIFGNIDLGDIPTSLRGNPGLYTLEAGKQPEREADLPPDLAAEPSNAAQNWFLAVGEKAGVTYVVASDQTMLERRETLSSWVITVGTFASVCASLWFGYTITSRLIRPLQTLAAATSDSDGTPINPAEYPPDEIGQLAQALRHKHDGLNASLVREKAFSAEVAHELRNPLAVIHSTMEIIERDTTINAQSTRALNRALDASREMNETLTALLLLGRERCAPVAYPPVIVASVLQPLVENSFSAPGTQLYFEQVGAAVLHAPREAIRIVAENLIRNALQNTPAGRVDVSLRDDRLIVSDTGIGIPPAELAAVRESGFRGSNAFGSGSGVGLALVERLCAAFDWRLDIQSELGKGSTISWFFDSHLPAPSAL